MVLACKVCSSHRMYYKCDKWTSCRLRVTAWWEELITTNQLNCYPFINSVLFSFCWLTVKLLQCSCLFFFLTTSLSLILFSIIQIFLPKSVSLLRSSFYICLILRLKLVQSFPLLKTCINIKWKRFLSLITLKVKVVI